MEVVEARGGFSGEGVDEGAGDMGGDIRCSGLGAGLGLGEELGTTMCLGLSGLSLRMTTGFSPPVDAAATGAALSAAVTGLVTAVALVAAAAGGLLNPITVGTLRREGKPAPCTPLLLVGLTTPFRPLALAAWPLSGLTPLTAGWPLDSRVMGMTRSAGEAEGLMAGEGLVVVLDGLLDTNNIECNIYRDYQGTGACCKITFRLVVHVNNYLTRPLIDQRFRNNKKNSIYSCGCWLSWGERWVWWWWRCCCRTCWARWTSPSGWELSAPCLPPQA